MASEVIEREMYNGLYHMVHNPNARGRAPRYKVNDEEKPKGVTTILGAVLAKDLVSWAVGAAISYIREKLPIVTEEDLAIAEKAHATMRDTGANTGTEAHLLVENYLKGIEQSMENVSLEAGNAYAAFLDWHKSVNPEMINVEEVIYSQSYKYAGTYDCMLRINGKVYLCDLKTTNASKKAPNGVYAENFIQLGAYAYAHEEQRQYEIANGGTKLVEIEGLMVISAKKNGKLDIVTTDDLGLTVAECGAMFRRIMDLYQFMTFVTNKLGGK